MAGNGDGLVALGFQFTGHLLTGLGLSAGDHDFGTQAGHFFGDGAADAFGGAGNQGDLAGHIKKRVSHRSVLILKALGTNGEEPVGTVQNMDVLLKPTGTYSRRVPAGSSPFVHTPDSAGRTISDTGEAQSWPQNPDAPHRARLPTAESVPWPRLRPGRCPGKPRRRRAPELPGPAPSAPCSVQ